MANAKSNFRAAVKKAKTLYRTGRYKTFADAVKAAYKNTAKKKPARRKKSVGRVSKKYRQTGTTNLQADRARRAKKPGKRKSASGRTYYERRANRSDAPGSLAGIKSAAKKMLKARLANKLLQHSLATTKRNKRKFGKEASAIKRDIKKFQ